MTYCLPQNNHSSPWKCLKIVKCIWKGSLLYIRMNMDCTKHRWLKNYLIWCFITAAVSTSLNNSWINYKISRQGSVIIVHEKYISFILSTVFILYILPSQCFSSEFHSICFMLCHDCLPFYWRSLVDEIYAVF
jgi:hypothetical protein